MKFFAIILVIVIFIFGICQLIPFRDIEERIKSGDIQFTKEIGWINWGHAKKESTQQAYDSFLELNKLCDSSFTYRYSQKMFYAIGHLGIRTTQTSFYSVQKIADLQTANEVFFEIYKTTSNSFESMQSDFPYSFFSSITSSSYRAGDLMGNLLSYYAVIENVNLDSIKRQFEQNTIEQSLAEFDKNSISKKYWKDVKKSSANSIALNKILNKDTVALKRATLLKETLKYSFE